MNSSTQPRTPWRLRQVSRRQLWVVLAGAMALWGVLLGAGALWAYQYMEGVAEFHDQRLTLHLPDLMHASADLNSTIHTRLDTELTLRVPIDQTLVVELPHQIQGQSQLNVDVPIDTEIAHQFVVDIQTDIDTQVSVAAWLPDVSVKFPLRLSVPVSLRVPVKTRVPLSLNLQAQARLPASVRVPVKTAVDILLPVHQPLQIEATSRAHFSLHATDRGMPVELTQTQLHLPLTQLQLLPR
jgi:hypothetical protein